MTDHEVVREAWAAFLRALRLIEPALAFDLEADPPVWISAIKRYLGSRQI